MKRLAILSAMATCAFAGEYAVLNSGTRLHAERHELNGDWVCLYTATGTIQIPSSNVIGFEQEEYVPPPPQSPVVDPPAAGVSAEAGPHSLIDAAAERHGLPKALLHSVVAAESGYRPDAVSPKGAIGLMQLMPETAQAYGANPYDPGQNVEAGARYLRDLLLKYDGGLYRALAAYNAGPGAVSKYRGVPPYRETRAYVNRVYRDFSSREKTLSGSSKNIAN